MSEEQPKQQFAIQRIYIKDSSFESPMGAKVFVENKPWKPEMKVDLNSRANKINDDVYEVILTITVAASLDGETVYLIELQQAGIFLVKGVDDENLRRAMNIMAPNLLFPYAREALDSLAIKGGFPHTGMQPVNFEALYMQAQQQQQADSTTEPH